MSTFRYSKEELERNKVLKYNLDLSRQLQNDPALARTRSETDANIAASEALLASLGRSSETAAAAQAAKAARERPLEHQPQARSWESLVSEAENAVPGEIVLEDILSPEEIEASFRELDEINARFAQKTGIVNRTDLAFLAIATALQVTKTLLFPYVAKVSLQNGEKAPRRAIITVQIHHFFLIIVDVAQQIGAGEQRIGKAAEF